jgi:prophage regulatory protein
VSNLQHVATKILAEDGERILRLPEVQRRVPLSTATIYARMKMGTFPRAISIGPRSVGWRLSQINHWIERQIARSGGEAA